MGNRRCDGRDDSMLGIMLRKLVSKKWMFICLLLGCVLLIATVVSFPLYRNAAFDKMLHDEFTVSMAENGEWPTKMRMAAISERKTGGARLHEMETLMDNVESVLDVVTKEKVFFYRLNKFRIISLMDKKDTVADLQIRLSYMSDLPEHVELLGGELYSETGISEDGAVEVVITQECMNNLKLLLGETLQFNVLKDLQGMPIKIKIVGIIKNTEGDYYWEIGTGEMKDACFMNENLFREYFVDNNIDNYVITCCYSYLFEYEELNNADVDILLQRLEENSDKYQGFSFGEVIEAFIAKRERISVALIILQIPVLVLLAAFLFMISGQMYELEKNEISVIKSRGSSGGQIFRLYIYQSIFLATTGALLGVPLGVFFSKILGSASNFLEFGLTRRLDTRFTAEVWIYLAAAAAATVLIMAVPAIKHSKVSIVHLKQKKAAKKKAWWERFFLDFICLAVSLYGWRNFSRNEDQLIWNMLMGRPLDPLLYLCSALFIIGMGLLYLRVQPLLVRLVYIIGQKRWHPAGYASFLENLKNGRKQQFIMLFLILTISLGIYHATVARTILQNARNNTEYLDGADVVMKEVWKSNLMLKDDEIESFTVKYYEPDASKYAALDCIEKYTKVMAVWTDDSKAASTGEAYIYRSDKRIDINFLAIHTREFGEITWVDSELLEKPYYTYLNELAEVPNGILMSRNCQTQLGLEVGNALQITYGAEGMAVQLDAKIVDFVDYWPGYAPTVTELTNDKESVVTKQNYLAVANLGTMQRLCGSVQPYEVWISLKEGTDERQIANWINENKLNVTKYQNREADLQADVENPLFQGTNGVLTMGFLVMILLCGVGYLIYWIMSIRSRELMFGVLRAFGMHKKELFHMLLIEQFFSGVLTILAGIGIGKLVSKLFVPMLQTAYTVSDQVFPMEVYSNASDMLRLYGSLALVMAVCLIVLIVLVVKLNVTKALKLGEE